MTGINRWVKVTVWKCKENPYFAQSRVLVFDESFGVRTGGPFLFCTCLKGLPLDQPSGHLPAQN